MSRFGWEQGKGLGAQESGMTTALGVQRAPAAAARSKKAKKKDPEAAQAAPAGMAGRSVVVDASREQRLAEQRTQMGGDASRVVLLTNMCAPDEVDDDLNGEVAEEANKVGVAERCFVRIVPGETRDDEAVRIFLVMSGYATGPLHRKSRRSLTLHAVHAVSPAGTTRSAVSTGASSADERSGLGTFQLT